MYSTIYLNLLIYHLRKLLNQAQRCKNSYLFVTFFSTFRITISKPIQLQRLMLEKEIIVLVGSVLGL